MKSKRNDDERWDWIQNDEGLYNWWRRSGTGKRAFLREHRTEIDTIIDAMESGRKPAHYLVYGG